MGVFRELSRESDRVAKAGSKSKLLKKMLDCKIGSKSVENMAATRVFERLNAEGRLREKKRNKGRKNSQLEGCARDPVMVVRILEILLKDARAHERMIVRNFLFLRGARMSELPSEERRSVTIKLQSRRDKLVAKLKVKTEEKIDHIKKYPVDCSAQHHLCQRIREIVDKHDCDRKVAKPNQARGPKEDPSMKKEKEEMNVVLEKVKVSDTDLKVETLTKDEPVVFGDLTLNEGEESIMEMRPEFSLFGRIDPMRLEEQMQVTNTKSRWTRMSGVNGEEGEDGVTGPGDTAKRRRRTLTHLG